MTLPVPYGLVRKALFRFDAETAHGMTVALLARGLVPRPPMVSDPRLAVSAFGLRFPNPVGMAAGFDKNAEVPEALLTLGFGFTEVGTVTPLAQDGNPRPRIFRLTGHDAMINRLGFNNAGHAAALDRLIALRRRTSGIVGVNIGANKDTPDKAADYVLGIERFAAVASYFTVNISSPNTPGLRDLQARAALADLLGRVMAARDAAAGRVGRSVPVLLKIAPDGTDEGFEDIAAEVLAHKVDGLIISNTTLDRAGVAGDRQAGEPGGLSGRPLFRRSTQVLARMRQRVGPALPIIGVGGIDSPAAALAKLEAGATLLQLYTGLVYQGPGLIPAILRALSEACAREGLASVADLSGRAVERWAG